MIHKALLAVAGTAIVAGSAYGGYVVIREQRMEQEQTRSQEAVRSGVRQTAGQLSDTEGQGNRPDGAGDGVPEAGIERADIMGRVEAVGDGYLDVVTFSTPGMGAGGGMSGRGNMGAGEPNEQPDPGEGETKRVYFDDGTEYFTAAGGPDAEQTEANFGDIGEGDMVSVWFTEGDDDTMRATRIVTREGGIGPANR